MTQRDIKKRVGFADMGSMEASGHANSTLHNPIRVSSVLAINGPLNLDILLGILGRLGVVANIVAILGNPLIPRDLLVTWTTA